MKEQCSSINEIAISTTKSKRDALAKFLLLAMLILATFMQKIAIPIAGIQIFFALPAIMIIAIYGFITHRLVIKNQNFFLYLIMTSTVIITQIIGGHDFSIKSLLLLIIIHIPYIFTLKDKSTITGIQYLYFQRIMIIIAIIGIFQYLTQFIIGTDITFFLDLVFPQDLIMQGYNGTIPLSYGDQFFKSNGFFMQEPSNFCQLLAVAIIIEIIYFKNLKRLIVFLIAIAFTFSGTGLILLFAITPIYLIQKRKFIILGFLILGVVTAPLWGTIIGIDRTINRTSEFTSTHSSAYARFFSIIPTLDTYIMPQANTLLFGLGAGSIIDTISSTKVDYERHNPSWGKMIFEYGIIGGFSYFIFIIFAIWGGSGSNYLKAALFIQLMILGEYILPPTLHSLILALIIWPNKFSYNKDFYLKGRNFFLKLQYKEEPQEIKDNS